MPMVWSIRNVVYAGILRRLAAEGWRVHLLLPAIDAARLAQPAYADFALAAGLHPLLTPDVRTHVRGKDLLNQVVRSAFHQRYQTASFPIYRRWVERDYSAAQRRRAAVINTLGRAATPRPLFAGLVRLHEAVYRREHDLRPLCDQLAALEPALLWSTVSVSSREHPYIRAAQSLDIPVVSSILSFDNLTSRSVLPTFDHYLVWNQRMVDQLLTYYPQVTPSQVTITGSPQFDFHHDPAFHWTREKTYRRLHIPAEARYLLYTASSQALAPGEPALVAGLAARLAEHDRLNDHWLVIRVHPLDNWQRWQSALDASDRAIISYPWQETPDAQGWALSSAEDQAFWVSTLLHADACINIASTTSLDAGILDRPIIGLRFDNEADAPRNILYAEYDTEHYVHLVNSGAIRLAHTWPELLDLLHEAIAFPERYHAERARMTASESGYIDGHAAARIVETLDRLVRTLPAHRQDSDHVHS